MKKENLTKKGQSMKKSVVIVEEEFLEIEELLQLDDKDIDVNIDFVKNSIKELKKDFTIRNDRYTIKFGGETTNLKYGELVLAIILLKTRYVLDRDLTMKDLFLCSKKDNVSKKISEYFTLTIEMATKEDADLDLLKAIMAKSLEELADMAFEINQSAGNSINIYDMLVLMQKNPKVFDLLNTKVRDNENDKVDYFEGNEKTKKANKELLDTLSSDEDYNCYKNLICAISPGQFRQVFCNIGYKPEITSSNIFPHCVDTNLFYGFRNEMDYFVSAMGARKALITNSLQVRRAGYTSRKLLLLVLNQKLSKVNDCKTENLVEIKIESKSMLKRFNNRFYKKEGDKKLSLINWRENQDLIGETLLFRSPITCSSPDGGICKTCYGELIKVNPFHIGVASILSLTQQLTQMLLSSKHLLQINPEKIKLPENLHEYFEVDGSNLISKKHFKINVTEFIVNDEDETMIKRMVVLDGDRSTEIFWEENEEIIVLETPDLVSKYKSDNIIDVTIDSSENLFRLNVENSELSTPLKNIIHLLESEARLNLERVDLNAKKKKVTSRDPGNYNKILSEFLVLLDHSEIRASSLTIELILRELLRNSEDIQQRPNFVDMKQMKFLKLTNALLNSPSAAITLAFERLNQVVETNMFSKTDESIIDGLY